jgi:hypothetical protein
MAEETQVNYGFQQKVGTTCKWLSNHAIPTWHKALHLKGLTSRKGDGPRNATTAQETEA